MQRQVLYLGEINASQREAWRKTIELQDAGTRRQVALFPAGSMPVEDVDAIGVRLSELSLRRPRQRGDCRQVVIALIVTPEGFPLSCEVMGGGTADSTTLSAFLDRIGDEGMTIARSDFAREDLKGITTGRRLDPMHPGAVLIADFIEPMGLTRYRVAKAIGVQQRRIDEICSGARAITADTAVRLGLAFGIDPQFWLNLQSQYDLEVVQREQGEQLAHAVRAIAA